MSCVTYELDSVVKDDKGADIERQPSGPKDGTVTEVIGSGVDNAGYHRRLSKRQIMMMTFGAGIGTGLWVGTGNALKYAGPAGTAVAYTILVHPFFGAKDKAGRPWISLLICGALGGGLCYLNCNKTAIQVYNWFSSLVGIAGFINWGAIFITQIRFRAALKAQGISPDTLPFKAPLAPWAHWLGLVIIIFILACEFYISVSPIGEPGTAVTFFANYLGMPLFLFDFVAYKLWFRTKLVKPSEVDFSEAKMFDEEDRLAREIMDDEALQKDDGFGLWQKAKNLVLG